MHRKVLLHHHKNRLGQAVSVVEHLKGEMTGSHMHFVVCSHNLSLLLCLLLSHTCIKPIQLNQIVCIIIRHYAPEKHFNHNDTYSKQEWILIRCEDHGRKVSSNSMRKDTKWAYLRSVSYKILSFENGTKELIKKRFLFLLQGHDLKRVQKNTFLI